jgi:hypothetical protein
MTGTRKILTSLLAATQIACAGIARAEPATDIFKQFQTALEIANVRQCLNNLAANLGEEAGFPKGRTATLACFQWEDGVCQIESPYTRDGDPHVTFHADGTVFHGARADGSHLAIVVENNSVSRVLKDNALVFFSGRGDTDWRQHLTVDEIDLAERMVSIDAESPCRAPAVARLPLMQRRV